MRHRDRPATEPPADPLDWRPQLPLPARRPRSIRNPILEPDWSGTHVLVHYDSAGGDAGGASVRIIDEAGEDATGDEPAVVHELLRAVAALDCVLDGFLTDEATRSGEGSFPVVTSNARLRLLARPRADIDVAPPLESEETPVAFVAVDVLRLDGEPLLDVPLLERKRLLESVVVASERVRISPYTQPPVEPWVATWKSAGLRGAVVKAANSRYVPSSETEEWTVVTELRNR